LVEIFVEVLPNFDNCCFRRQKISQSDIKPYFSAGNAITNFETAGGDDDDDNNSKSKSSYIFTNNNNIINITASAATT